MVLLKFQYRKKQVVVTGVRYNSDMAAGFTVSYGDISFGTVYFIYHFDPVLFERPNAGFLCFLKSFVKSYIDLQFYGRISEM